MAESPADPSISAAEPDFTNLVRFLVKPFLEEPESLKVDCEISRSRSRVWVRLAFEGSDKGRVFGRGGRNIQAIRVVLDAAAKLAGYSAYLDIYGDNSHSRHDSTDQEGRGERPTLPRRGASGKVSSRAHPKATGE
jgi:hypothetical protein